MKLVKQRVSVCIGDDSGNIFVFGKLAVVEDVGDIREEICHVLIAKHWVRINSSLEDNVEQRLAIWVELVDGFELFFVDLSCEHLAEQYAH
tara:strand:+ start:3138 stop:3410 length:273 start_codon:yes stop_codon:yes gene_type:complete